MTMYALIIRLITKNENNNIYNDIYHYLRLYFGADE